jgi:hypothetical protein
MSITQPTPQPARVAAFLAVFDPPSSSPMGV